MPLPVSGDRPCVRPAGLEIAVARFGSSDYDYEIDLAHSAKMARVTLESMEDEKSSILTRREMAQAKQRGEG